MARSRTRKQDVEPGDGLVAAQLERLLAANQHLQEEVDGHHALEVTWREERALLLAMINQVPDYLFAKGRDTLYLMANHACARDLGLDSGEEMIGRTDLELGHDLEVVRKFIDDDQSVISSERAKLDIDEYMITSTGDKKWLSTSKVPLRNEAGVVIGMVGVARDVTERKLDEERIHFLAYHDPLTGLPNRLLFEQQLEQAASGAGSGGAAALLYLDLDRFKIVNDTLGHPAGDELIRQVAQRVSSVLRATDTVARLGGDEFAVLMADCSSADAEALSRRILNELKRQFTLFDDPVFINVSIGIAIAVSGGGPMDGTEMLRRADIALYRAKAHGRGRYEIFTKGMATAVEETRQIEQDLRQALTDGTGLYTVYQPVFDAADGEIVGAEALVRWDHPARGTLGPQVFIGVAEERGQIDALGELMLRQACSMIRRTDLPWVAVNVSPVQFRNERFDQVVLGIIAESGLTPDRIQIEITEGLLIESANAVQDTIRRLRAAGVTVALDDFGTGYSSMNYLRRYNVDKLKIDRSFVAQLGTSEHAAAIVTAMVTLARAMQMRVTAEGVETAVQCDLLIAMGCHELQGFFLARPMAGEVLEKLWNAQKRSSNGLASKSHPGAARQLQPAGKISRSRRA